MGPEAKVIADSISPEGVRLTTMQVTFHRFVLSEMNTHRTFSRNSASSRAIPVDKLLARFRYAPAYPLEWPAEQPGMQGGVSLTGKDLQDAETLFEKVQNYTHRELMSYLSVHIKPQRLHKSLLNRLMEWGQWHTAVVTATAWDNFFEQRCSDQAQPEIRVPAEMMREAMAASTPETLRPGEYHLPYVEEQDWNDLADLLPLGVDMYPHMAQVSAARCARTSYLTQEGKRDIGEDLDLYARLTERTGKRAADPIHWSPLEHVATPWPENRQDDCPSLWIPGPDTQMLRVPTAHLPRVGNLLGWRSLRTEVETQRAAVTFR